MPNRDRLWTFGASILLLGALTLFNLDHIVDDAFISFRYAENLVHGQGLVFNPGERVEGYTNFLWVMLMAPFIAGSIDPEAASKVLGFLASAGTLAAVARFSPGPTGASWVGWIAPLFLASSPPFVVWATGGMETPLFTCLLTWAAVLAVEGLRTGVLATAVGGLLGAAALTRPEGAGVALLLALLAWTLGPRTSVFRHSFRRCFGLCLAIVLPYFLWRWWYYGQFLPNTFYAKVGIGWQQILRGVYYAHVFFSSSGYWLLLPLIGLRWTGRRLAAVALGVLALALLGYTIFVGGDALPMFRFLVPLLPALFLLLAMGAVGILARFGSLRFSRPVLGGILLAVAVWAARLGFAGAPYEDVQRDIGEVSAWQEIGAWLHSHAPPDATIAVIPAGVIPYVSKLRAIDMLGLNDATIAHRQMPELGSGLPGHEKFDVDYVLSRRPDIILLGVYGLEPRPLPPQDLIHYSYEAEWRMLDSPRFLAEYKLRRGRAAGGYFPYFLRSE